MTWTDAYAAIGMTPADLRLWRDGVAHKRLTWYNTLNMIVR
jgi:hypothetical protein